ncbi:ATP-dependent Clp protease proteolytic subunit [Bradyrhizobium barranii subsp. barranii]|uniref:ATP-dependent Clp protease proteolytic subunit n=1 Tax=Bradyrhizobium barranii subsp. barranii TaxID=2823807 RepID=A0A939S1Q1_9BRAD|nr:ATP-dependent Clp protease proteolytic subunit [Bradyrhizobium barranii]UEM13682.1 ATP-dependent Clp protease proteolytic subunit [Bradyrhizobium barranii subsp. barranii]
MSEEIAKGTIDLAALQASGKAVRKQIGDEALITPETLVLDLVGDIGEQAELSLASIRDRLLIRCYKHIHLRITSAGGKVAEAHRIYTALRAQPLPVSAFVRGKCESAAIDVLLAASLRCASSDACLLLHQTRRERDTLPPMVTATALLDVLNGLTKSDEDLVDLLRWRAGADPDWSRQEMLTEDPLHLVVAIEIGLLHHVDRMTSLPDPAWPSLARSVSASGIHVPRRLLRDSYLDACRAMEAIQGMGGTGRSLQGAAPPPARTSSTHSREIERKKVS